MQPTNSQANAQKVTRDNQRQEPEVPLNRIRRSRGLLLAAVAALACAGCASLPSPSDNANNAGGCVGPVSFCNTFFGS